MLNEVIRLMQELVQNKCVNPPGEEMRSIQTIKEFLDSYEIHPEVFKTAPERGNLLAEIKGTGSGPTLMFGPSHVDVVPIEDPDEWEVPPFDGVIKEECIWGRGAFDMLYLVATQTVAFAYLSKEGFRPKGDLKLLIVADEEAGGEYGSRWLVEHHPSKVETDYALTEFGGMPVSENRIVYSYGEKGSTSLRLSFKGTEQLGSMPYMTDNAIKKMAEAVRRLSDYDPPKDTTLILRLLDGMGIGGVQRFLMKSKRLLPRMLRIVAKDSPGTARLLHSLSQMTISPNMCSGGTKVNVIPGAAHVNLDIRTLPGQDHNYLIEHLNHALGDLISKMEVSLIEEEGDPSYGNASQYDSDLVDVLASVTKKVRGPDTSLVPMVVPGATDLRFFREAFGTQGYGFGVFDDTLDIDTATDMSHANNERITIGTLDMTSKAYYQIAKEFLG